MPDKMPKSESASDSLAPVFINIKGSKTAMAELTSDDVIRTDVIGRVALNNGFSCFLGLPNLPLQMKNTSNVQRQATISDKQHAHAALSAPDCAEWTFLRSKTPKITIPDSSVISKRAAVKKFLFPPKVYISSKKCYNTTNFTRFDRGNS